MHLLTALYLLKVYCRVVLEAGELFLQLLNTAVLLVDSHILARYRFLKADIARSEVIETLRDTLYLELLRLNVLCELHSAYLHL